MALQEFVDQLLTIQVPTEQRQLLTERLNQIDVAEVEELADLLMKNVVRFLRADVQLAMQSADLILLLADICLKPSIKALGLRAQAQVKSTGLGQYELALALYEEAIQLHKSLKDDVGIAKVEVTRVVALSYTMGYEAASTAGDWASDILEKAEEWRLLASLYNNLSTINRRWSDNERALALLTKAYDIYLNLGEEGLPYLTNNAINRALVLRDLCDFKASIYVSNEAIELANKHQQKTLIARAQNNLGFTYQKLGDYNQALFLLESAQSIWQAEGRLDSLLNNHHAICDCLLSLRRFTNVLDKCQEIHQNFISKEHWYGLARTYLLEVAAHVGLLHYQAAFNRLDEAKKAFQIINHSYWIILSDLQKADILFRQQKYGESYQTAIDCAEAFQALGHSMEEAQAYIVAARSAAARQNFKQAQQLAMNALLVKEKVDVPTLTYEAHHILGLISEGESDFRSAFDHYKIAIDELDRLQQRTITEFRPTFLLDDDKRLLYEQIVYACLELDMPHLALQYVERCKSRALMDLLSFRSKIQIQARAQEDIPLVQELNRLRELSRTLNQPVDEDNNKNANLSADKILNLEKVEKQITNLWHKLLIRNSVYEHDMVGSKVPIASLEFIAKKLNPDSILVEYFVTKQEVLVFLVAASEQKDEPRPMHIHRMPIKEKDIERLLQAFTLNLGTIHKLPPERIGMLIPNVQRVLQQLYQFLIMPVVDRLSDFSHLIIVPHGALHYLPFHALHDGISYLAEKYEISYLPASSLLRHHGGHHSDKPNRKLGVVGHSYNGRLPYAIEEAKQIMKLSSSSELLLEEQAALSEIERLLPECDIFHCATHGDFRGDNPLFSGLAFADGWLTTLDIFNLRLRTSLVTLSACQTGRNVIGGGDELLGLMRAFFVAGVKSLLLSHWAIEDRSTAQFMKCFYSQLVSGASKSAALQAAQLSFLHNPTDHSDHTMSVEPTYLTHPYFWASFFLVGVTGTL